jgi:type II secretory pathway pseudopilin PulG
MKIFKKGMTLIEILIYISLFFIIMLGILSSISDMIFIENKNNKMDENNVYINTQL